MGDWMDNVTKDVALYSGGREQFTLRFPSSLLQRIDQLANEHNISRNDLFITIMQHGVPELEKRLKENKKAE